jgi:hypothetical protein
MEGMDFTFQIVRDHDIMVRNDPTKRLYLCVPHHRYGYACYLKDSITHTELNGYGATYARVRSWYPRFLDQTVLKWNLESPAKIIHSKRN